jgi:hypothetical protein
LTTEPSQRNYGKNVKILDSIDSNVLVYYYNPAATKDEEKGKKVILLTDM